MLGIGELVGHLSSPVPSLGLESSVAGARPVEPKARGTGDKRPGQVCISDLNSALLNRKVLNRKVLYGREQVSK